LITLPPGARTKEPADSPRLICEGMNAFVSSLYGLHIGLVDTCAGMHR
jgi:hypothetical protein